jgi:hypothetical protein
MNFKTIYYEKIKILSTVLILSITVFAFQKYESSKEEMSVESSEVSVGVYTRALVTFSSVASSKHRSEIRLAYELYYGHFNVLSCEEDIELWQWKDPTGGMGWPGATDGAEKPMDLSIFYQVIWNNNASCQLPN